MQLHVEAEFTHDPSGRLVRVNEPAGDAAPRFFLGQTATGVIRRFRHDVPDDLQRELEITSAPERLGEIDLDRPLDTAPFVAILARIAPVRRTSTGLAYRFPDTEPRRSGTRILRDDADAELLRPLLPAWIPDIRNSAPLVALVIDGRAVAVCGSVRISPRAHEAGVETAIGWRGHGHALAVVARWAAAVRDEGAEPLYSTTWENTASRALARKLGLIPVGRDLHIM